MTKKKDRYGYEIWRQITAEAYQRYTISELIYESYEAAWEAGLDAKISIQPIYPFSLFIIRVRQNMVE